MPGILFREIPDKLFLFGQSNVRTDSSQNANGSDLLP